MLYIPWLVTWSYNFKTSAVPRFLFWRNSIDSASSASVKPLCFSDATSSELSFSTPASKKCRRLSSSYSFSLFPSQTAWRIELSGASSGCSSAHASWAGLGCNWYWHPIQPQHLEGWVHDFFSPSRMLHYSQTFGSCECHAPLWNRHFYPYTQVQERKVLDTGETQTRLCRIAVQKAQSRWQCAVFLWSHWVTSYLISVPSWRRAAARHHLSQEQGPPYPSSARRAK